MSSSEQAITPALLRDWELPAAGDSEYGRDSVVVVGGPALAVAFPEAGVVEVTT